MNGKKKAAEAEWKDPHNFDRYKIAPNSQVMGAKVLDKELKNKQEIERVAVSAENEETGVTQDGYTVDADEEQIAKIFASPLFKTNSQYEQDA